MAQRNASYDDLPILLHQNVIKNNSYHLLQKVCHMDSHSKFNHSNLSHHNRMHNCTETTLSCSHCNLLLTYHTMIIVPSKKQSPIHLLSVPIKIEHTQVSQNALKMVQSGL